MKTPQYPVGSFEAVTHLNAEERQLRIARLAAFPLDLKAMAVRLNSSQWEQAYRPGGWTAIQVLNHLADSHLHSYARFKHAVTEDSPTIKDYPEALWAALEEGQDKASVEASIHILKGIHYRWVAFLHSLSESDFDKTFYHPETETHHSLHKALAYYSWHCDHHLGHLNIIAQIA